MKSAEAFVLCSVKLHTDCSGFCLFFVSVALLTVLCLSM